MKFVNNLDLNKNELQNARIQNLATAPGTPVEGQIYNNTSDHKTYVWNGSAWVYYIPSNESLDAATLGGQNGAYYLDRAHHSGTQAAATISDFDSQVRSSRLDQMAVPTASVSLNSQKITNLLDPTNPQEAATKNYVDNSIQGLNAKASVKAATTTDITRSGEQTIDDISLVAGDRVLVKNQATPAENGIFVVATGAWGRASDTDTWGELVSAYVFVERGTANADTGWTCTVNAGGTLNVTDIPWVQFSGSGASSTASNVGTAGVGVFKQKTGNDLEFKKLNPGSNKVSITDDTTNSKIDIDVVVANLGLPGKYSVAVGNNSATNFTVTHNLGTRDVVVSIRETNTPYAVVIADIECTDTNTVTVKFAVAPTTNQYTVTVIG